jgi:hypothetical protein
MCGFMALAHLSSLYLLPISLYKEHLSLMRYNESLTTLTTDSNAQQKWTKYGHQIEQLVRAKRVFHVRL